MEEAEKTTQHNERVESECDDKIKSIKSRACVYMEYMYIHMPFAV